MTVNTASTGSGKTGRFSGPQEALREGLVLNRGGRSEGLAGQKPLRRLTFPTDQLFPLSSF